MSTTSAALLILVMLLFSFYEKNGQTLEVILVWQAKLEKEVRTIVEKAVKPESVQSVAKRKLTRAERKQMKPSSGKPHTVQDSIPFRNLYPDGSEDDYD